MAGEWSHGLCGCFDNFGICIITYFVPCYTHGKSAEAVGDDCLLCGLSQLIPFANIFFAAQIRQKVREQKGIEGSFVNDILMSWCCYLCSQVQVAQEVQGAAPGGQSMARE